MSKLRELNVYDIKQIIDDNVGDETKTRAESEKANRGPPPQYHLVWVGDPRIFLARSKKNEEEKVTRNAEKKKAIPEILGCGEDLRKGEGAVIFILELAWSSR